MHFKKRNTQQKMLIRLRFLHIFMYKGLWWKQQILTIINPTILVLKLCLQILERHRSHRSPTCTHSVHNRPHCTPDFTADAIPFQLTSTVVQ